MEYEKQLGAMKTIMETLASLDDVDRRAVMIWVNGQIGLTPPAAAATSGQNLKTSATTREGTVSVVAQKLHVSSARDLLLAAAAHITIYQGKENFTKDELVACAKEARSWKAAYSNQMASNIKRMANAGVLFEKSRDIFSLSDAALADVEGRI